MLLNFFSFSTINECFRNQGRKNLALNGTPHRAANFFTVLNHSYSYGDIFEFLHHKHWLKEIYLNLPKLVKVFYFQLKQNLNRKKYIFNFIASSRSDTFIFYCPQHKAQHVLQIKMHAWNSVHNCSIWSLFSVFDIHL